MVDITDIAMATEEDRLHSADEAAEEALLDALLEDWFSVHCPNGATQRSHCCTCSSHPRSTYGRATSSSSDSERLAAPSIRSIGPCSGTRPARVGG